MPYLSEAWTFWPHREAAGVADAMIKALVMAALSYWCLRKTNGNIVTVTGGFRSPGIAEVLLTRLELWAYNQRIYSVIYTLIVRVCIYSSMVPRGGYI